MQITYIREIRQLALIRVPLRVIVCARVRCVCMCLCFLLRYGMCVQNVCIHSFAIDIHYVFSPHKFRDSLNALMESIGTTEPHYVRCIKPNDQKRELLFEPLRVIHQLRCGGVLGEC